MYIYRYINKLTETIESAIGKLKCKSDGGCLVFDHMIEVLCCVRPFLAWLFTSVWWKGSFNKAIKHTQEHFGSTKYYLNSFRDNNFNTI